MSAVATRPSQPSPAELKATDLTPISWKAPVVYGVLSFIALVGFAIFTKGSAVTRLVISSKKDASNPGDWITFPEIELPSALVAWICVIIMVGLTAWAVRSTSRRSEIGLWLPSVFGVAFVFAFLTWVLSDNEMGIAVTLTGLLQSALFMSVPLVFGAMAGTVCEHVGVINVAIEGQLLAGAFLAATVATISGNPYVGLLAAPLAGALVGALLALFAVRYWVDHIIVGVVLNVLVIGVTSYLFSTVMTNDPKTWNSPEQLTTWAIPVLSRIPLIGPVLFRQNAVVYAMYALVIVLQIFMFRSRWGLRMRACGEHPKAADTVGIKVNRTRIRNTILGGAIAGLGGAFFTVAQGLAFGKEMSAGKGYIALAAMILGRWNPKSAVAAAVLFGFADALQQLLSPAGTAIPGNILLMAPYLVTILAVAGLVGRVVPPAAEGKPYDG